MPHMTNEQLRDYLLSLGSGTDSPRLPDAAGQHVVAGQAITIEWLNPPIPGAAGWYWNRDEQAVNGPFQTSQAALDDAQAELEA